MTETTETQTTAAPPFEHARNGYHAGQVEEFVARAAGRIRDLEGQLAQAVRNAEHRRDPGKLIIDLVADGLAELEGHRAQMHAILADERAQAAETARQALEAAHGDAQQILDAAQSQADMILAQARGEAARMLSDASARAAAITSRAGELKDAHGDALHRMAVIRDALQAALDHESQLAPLSG